MKPIETRFAGYRWAVFFKSLGVEWRYEMEGFEFEGERYLPDFWLPGSGQYVEVKGDPDCLERELPRLTRFARHAERDVVVLGDIPELERGRIPTHLLLTRLGGEITPVVALMAEDTFLATTVPYPTRRLSSTLQMTGIVPSDATAGAYLSARYARFEHGESGVA